MFNEACKKEEQETQRKMAKCVSAEGRVSVGVCVCVCMAWQLHYRNREG